MQETTFEVVLGDYSDDGHGKTFTTLVKLSAPAISEALVAEAYEETKTLLGVGLEEVCEDYEDSRIDDELYERLVGLGFQPPANDSRNGPHIYVEPLGYGEKQESFSALSLLMFYIGRTIPDFSWERVELPSLMGWRSILSDSSFGYGLFS